MAWLSGERRDVFPFRNIFFSSGPCVVLPSFRGSLVKIRENMLISCRLFLNWGLDLLKALCLLLTSPLYVNYRRQVTPQQVV